ncbi:DUF397 domain-containing protein [Streptomyces cellulosae]|uniref:DUF397 domain-containing protein n=1 Tax=Streptomyces cellulosae TaxID=1968 RepID=UPI0019000F93|nr:DUF397 domain-containing protein [Streptomyces cellulosae]
MDQSPRVWFTSSYSNGAGGECVECALTGERALIRDSKNASGPVVAVRDSAWCSFVQALAHGTWNDNWKPVEHGR